MVLPLYTHRVRSKLHGILAKRALPSVFPEKQYLSDHFASLHSSVALTATQTKGEEEGGKKGKRNTIDVSERCFLHGSLKRTTHGTCCHRKSSGTVRVKTLRTRGAVLNCQVCRSHAQMASTCMVNVGTEAREIRCSGSQTSHDVPSWHPRLCPWLFQPSSAAARFHAGTSQVFPERRASFLREASTDGKPTGN